MKKCRVCNIELKESNWAKSLMSKNSKICKECHNNKVKNWRKANKSKVNNYSLEAYYRNPKKSHKSTNEYRKKLRIEMINEYGGKCIKCGITDYDVLSIDHIDNTGAEDRKNGLYGYNLYRKLKKDSWPKDNYQLLCRNCNWKKELKRKSSNANIQSN